MAAATAVAINCGGGRDEVYVAATPLRGSKGPAQLVFSTAYSLNIWDLQHFMVIIKPSSSSSSSSSSSHEAVVYDFQPEDPENIWVAVAALSGRNVPGVILMRKLGKLPKRKCWLVGYAKENAIDEAHKFNNNWETDLKIGNHDCRHYSQGLVEYLTGERDVLERLRESSRNTI